jgi:hypothetical protein
VPRHNTIGFNRAVGIPLLGNELGLPTCPHSFHLGDLHPTHVHWAFHLCLSIVLPAQASYARRAPFAVILTLNRIWIFSQGSILIVGSILAICLITLGFDFFITVKILQVPQVTEFGAYKGEIIAIFMSGAVGMYKNPIHDIAPCRAYFFL